MGVYIHGMEMPKDGGWITVRIYPDGTCGRPGAYGDCTLYKGARAVPVPKHGRLVDADALEQNAQKRLLMCNQNDNQFQKPYEVMRAIALAPTIIPAEEGE